MVGRLASTSDGGSSAADPVLPKFTGWPQRAKADVIVREITVGGAQLAEERQAQAEDLAMRYAQITGAARRHDFSLPASRERKSVAAATGLSAEERQSVDLPAGALGTTLDVASGKRPMPVSSGFSGCDGLLDMLKNNYGSARVMRSSTQHTILGGSSEGPSSSSGANLDLAATIRAAAMQH